MTKKSEQEIFYVNNMGPCWSRSKTAKYVSMSERNLYNKRESGLEPLPEKIKGHVVYPAVWVISWHKRPDLRKLPGAVRAQKFLTGAVNEKYF